MSTQHGGPVVECLFHKPPLRFEGHQSASPEPTPEQPQSTMSRLSDRNETVAAIVFDTQRQNGHRRLPGPRTCPASVLQQRRCGWPRSLVGHKSSPQRGVGRPLESQYQPQERQCEAPVPLGRLSATDPRHTEFAITIETYTQVSSGQTRDAVRRLASVVPEVYWMISIGRPTCGRATRPSRRLGAARTRVLPSRQGFASGRAKLALAGTGGSEYASAGRRGGRHSHPGACPSGEDRLVTCRGRARQ